MCRQPGNLSCHFLGSLLDVSRYLDVTLAARNNGRLRNDGCNREQHNKHSEAFQLTGKGVNYKASPSTRHIERVGRGGLATGQNKRPGELGGGGGKATVTLIASGASWLSTRQSLPGNKPEDLWQLGDWTPERVIQEQVLFLLIWVDLDKTASLRRKFFSSSGFTGELTRPFLCC